MKIEIHQVIRISQFGACLDSIFPKKLLLAAGGGPDTGLGAGLAGSALLCISAACA